MMTLEADNLARARGYIQDIERGLTGAALAAYFAPGVIQEEFPNRLVPQGARRDLAAILEGAERGQEVMRAQRYDILNAIADGDYVALEVAWAGTLAIPVGTLAAGGEMRARFAVFLQFGDGKIVRQRNYDCFEPW